MNLENKWLIFIAAGLLILLINLDATIVNLALPIIGDDFKIPLATLKWVINIYLLASAALFLIGGRLSELIGHRHVFLIGLCFFGIGSLIAGFAHDITTLLLARAIQGIGFACTLSQALILIAEAFPQEQQGLAVGLSVVITGLGQALGPTAGGLLLTVLNWHWMFLINVPICIASFLMILFLCPTKKITANLSQLDILSSLLFIIALTGFIFGISGISNGYHVTIAVISLLGSIGLFIVFYKKNKKSSSPLLDFSLFKITTFKAVILIRCVFMLTWVSLLFAIPIFLQNILGYNPMQAGFIILSMTLLFAVTSPIAGRLADTIGIRKPAILGIIAAIITLLLLALPQVQGNLILTLMALLPFGLSGGILVPMTIIGIINSVPIERKGTGMGLLFTIGFIGASLGTIMGSAIFSHLSWYKFKTLLIASQLSFPDSAQDILKITVSGATAIDKLNIDSGLSLLQINQLTPLIQKSFNFGFSIFLLLCLLLMLAVIPLTRHLKK